MTDPLIYKVLMRVKEQLALQMVTGVALDDPARLEVCKIGLFQEDPTRRKLHIYIQAGSHEEPNLEDGIASLESFKNIAWKVPPREFGGGEMWWRNGVVHLGCYLVGKGIDEEEAHRLAYTVLARLQDALDSIVVSDLYDDKERAVLLFAPRTTMFQSGGPPKSFIFRGKVFFQFLTERKE